MVVNFNPTLSQLVMSTETLQLAEDTHTDSQPRKKDACSLKIILSLCKRKGAVSTTVVHDHNI